jgi:hypothetical protein
MWFDEKFATCSMEAKVLFFYLISNDHLGLTPYLHITDRQIMFDTGLTFNQLETGKKELTSLRWCFFTENWVYHNHDCAYIDYEGRDRVIDAKNKELQNIPIKVQEYFNPLITRYKPVLNHKSEIINPKSETINQKSKTEELKKQAHQLIGKKI